MKLRGRGAFLKALQNMDWDYTLGEGSIVVYGPRGLRFVVRNYTKGNVIQNAWLDILQTEGVRTFSARILNLRTWDELFVLIRRLQEWYQVRLPDVGAAWKRYIAIFSVDAEMEFNGVTVSVYLYSENNFYCIMFPAKDGTEVEQKEPPGTESPLG